MAALVLVPLYFDKYESGTFEGPKTLLLRALACVALAAWTTKALATGTVMGAERAKVIASLALPLALASALACGLSLSTTVSVWGNRGSNDGAINLWAQLTLFAAVAANLRTQAQLRRLLDALILPTIPITLYAVFQRLGLEPLHVTMRETTVERVTSMFGQPVYLAGYLIMVAPITAQRAFAARRGKALFVYAPLLALQLMTLALTESRGPWIALLSGAVFALLVHAARRGSRRTVAFVWSLAAVVALAVALQAPGRSTNNSRFLRRAEDTFAVHGSGGDFRAANWRVAVRLLVNRDPAELADGRHDQLPWLRPVVGYGPDVLHAVAAPFLDDELVRDLGYFLVRHLHNDLWDALLETGIVGLLAALAVQLVLLRRLLRRLAFAPSPRAFYGSAAAGALCGALAWSLLHGPGFVFLGLQLGLLGGLALLISARAWRPPVADATISLELALLAGLTAHVVETSFSFTVVATGLVFWIGAALASVDVEPSEESAQSGLVDVALSSWVTFALGFGFLGASTLSPNSSTVLRDGLVMEHAGARVPVGALLLLISLTWGTALLRVGRGWHGWAARFSAAIALAWGFWAWHAALLAKLAVVRAPLEGLELAARAIDGFYLATFVLVLVLAFGLRPRTAPLTTLGRPMLRAGAIALVLASAAAGVLRGALEPAHAEAAVALANARRDKNQFEPAELLYRAASELRSEVGAYRAMLARSLAQRARVEGSPSALAQAERAIHAAIAADPTEGESAVNQALILGQLSAGAGESDPGLRRRALESYTRALRLHPFDPALLRAYAIAQLTLFHELAAALKSARHAVELEPLRALNHATLGDVLLASARDQNGTQRAATLREAALSYERASAGDPQQAAFRLGAGRAYLVAGQNAKAAKALRTALAALPASARERPAAVALLRRAESDAPQD